MKLCRTAFALVISWFVPVTGQSQTCSAECSQWCGNEGLIFPGSNGRIVNVAFGKPASVSSRFSDSDGTSAPACIAVNGRTNTTYRATQQTNTNCIHTHTHDFNASWSVDLGRNYTVTNISIYRRKGFPRRMSGLHVEVDNQTCYTFPLMADSATALDALPEKIDVTCTPPLTGRVVRLQKRGQEFNYVYAAQLINVCEVQVWGCVDAYVGPDCQCGHCRDGARCDVTTLGCPGGCDRGWKTRFCNMSCSAYQYNYDCGERCGQCADSDTCNTMTGLCPNGCQPGWQGDNCKQECADGFYGQRCSSRCGDCSDGEVCDKVNGTCPTGCQPGFDPSDRLCKSRCPADLYGQNCTRQCGQCKDSAPCDAVTGHCDVCQPNLLHPLCQECEGSRYGPSCDLQCSARCGGDGSCDRITGQCQDGCEPGYVLGQSGLCTDKCPDGTFGSGCSQMCGQCVNSSVCRHDNGFCEQGCSDGFSGILCDTNSASSEDSQNLAGPIAGAVFGGLCVIAVSILIVGIIRRRSKRQSQSAPAVAMQGSAIQSGGSDNLAVITHQMTSPADTASDNVTEEENHYYDELQTPDDSDGAPYSSPVFRKGNENKMNPHVYANTST